LTDFLTGGDKIKFKKVGGTLVSEKALEEIRKAKGKKS
jgi:hypothetical protein